MFHALAEQQGVELGSSYKATDSARFFTHFIAARNFVSPCPLPALCFSASWLMVQQMQATTPNQCSNTQKHWILDLYMYIYIQFIVAISKSQCNIRGSLL